MGGNMGGGGTRGDEPSGSLAGDLTPEQRDLVIRHIPLNVTVCDEEGKIVYWHGDLGRLLQASGVDVAFMPGVDGVLEDCDPRYIGRHYSECHPESARVVIAHIEKAFREGTRQEAVYRRLEAGRLILVRYCPLRDAEGTYRGMMETMEDITDVREMEGEKLTGWWTSELASE
jgi:uncharacterized protein